LPIFLNLMSDIGHQLSDIICPARAEGHLTAYPTPHTPYPFFRPAPFPYLLLNCPFF
jgi:hypothetical protein